MKLITLELEQRFKEVGDQSEVENPIVVAKFFDPTGSGTWYATEYDAETNICYGYVTGLGYNEWGRFSVQELEFIERPFGLTIERDIHFSEINFYELFPQQQRLAELDREEKSPEQELEL